MRRYWVAWCFLAGFAAVQDAYLLLSAPAGTSLLTFASTSVANLEHDPAGCLVVSAFVSGGGLASTLTWLPLIAIALFGACRAIGGARTVAVCAAGHVIGTLVSEGIVGWRVHAGALPVSQLHLLDVGPSYVVVSALVAAIVCAPWSWRDRPDWAWRVLAAAALLLLVFPGQIFSGLTTLDVAAVGHVTAITTALLLAVLARRFSPGVTAGQAAMPPTARPIR
jgi:rhomboid family protein